MEKRAALFLVLSVAILMGYSLVYSRLFPPPPRPLDADKPVAARDQDDPVDDRPTPDQPEDSTNEPRDTADIGPGADPADSDTPDSDTPDSADSTAEVQYWQSPDTRELIALGSLAKDSPFRFLALLDSRGGTIRRVELNERNEDGVFRYRDLDHRHGYLGHLELVEQSDGFQVTIVGAGTPAALAEPVGHQADPGLEPGDRILQVDNQPVAELVRLGTDEMAGPASKSNSPNLDRLHAYLKTTRPGDVLDLLVRRGNKDLKFQARLTRWPLEILRPEQSHGYQHPQSMLLAIGEWRDEQWNLLSERMHTDNWETKIISTDDVPGVEFRFVVDHIPGEPERVVGPIEIIKRFQLTPTPQDELANESYRSYHISLDFEIRNQGEQPQSIAYQMDGPTGAPSEGWWYQTKVNASWAAAGARDIAWSSEGRNGFLVLGCPAIFKSALDDEPVELFDPPPGGPHPNRVMRGAGIDTLSFAAIVQPAPDEDSDQYAYVRGHARSVAPVTEEDKVRSKKTDTSFRLISESITIDPNESMQRRFELFAGPKQPELLREYGLEPLNYFGWFGVVSKPLIWLLHLFESLPLVNYGLAIIILTILVRSAMVPISRKAAKNAQMMQVLAPQMKKIAEQYKNDMEKRGKAQQELFRQYNYNPFSGCLLMFLQLPIFIGLYRGLAVDIALRDQPLIPGVAWCSNLAGPDKLLNWSGFMPSFIANEGVGMFALGPYLNILPLITVVLFLIQQKLFTPPPTDEQQALTHKMMSFMTIFIGIMFFKVPSGLCVYFITSSIWGIAERKLLPKPKLPEHLRNLGDDSDPKKSKPSSKPGSNGASRSQKAFLKKKRQKGKR